MNKNVDKRFGVFQCSGKIQLLPYFSSVMILKPTIQHFHSRCSLVSLRQFSKAKAGYEDINDDSNQEYPGHNRPRHGDQIRGLGTDVAVIQSMVFVAQFFLSLCMGSIVQAVDSTVAVVVSACILSFLGSLMATQVLYAGL